MAWQVWGQKVDRNFLYFTLNFPVNPKLLQKKKVDFSEAGVMERGVLVTEDLGLGPLEDTTRGQLH